MKRDIVTAVFAALMLSVIGLGCFRWQTKKTAEAPAAGIGKAAAASRADTLGGYLRALASSPASGPIAEAMDGLVYAGTLFLILGGVAIFFSARSAGVTLMGVGTLLVAVGVLFTQYPWIVLVIAAVVGILAGISAYAQRRDRKRLEETTQKLNAEHSALEVAAEAIQTVPEGKAIKEAIKDRGDVVAGLLDAVIDPIKEKLRAEGRI